MNFPIRGGSAMWDLQVALYRHLTQDAELRQRLTKIYDGEVPEDVTAQLPYAVIGDMTELPQDRLTTTGNELTVTIHVYSNYAGSKEAKLAGGRIVQILNQCPNNLAVDGFAVNTLTIDFNQMITEGDGIRHLILRFRVRLQPLR